MCVLNYYAKRPLRMSGLSNMELLGWKDVGKKLSESHSHLVDKCQFHVHIGSVWVMHFLLWCIIPS